MLDVHPPHAPTHTWRDFFIHIATIVVGLLIAVGLEQSVEALHHHHQAEHLRNELHAESEQILSDSRRTDASMVYRIQCFNTRIRQVQAVVFRGRPLEPESANEPPYFASPDIPIWRSARSSGVTSLLTEGEVNAFAEVEYVQTRTEALIDAFYLSETHLRSFTRALPPLPGGAPDFSKASPADLKIYLSLLTAAAEATDSYLVWIRILKGAEIAVIAGQSKLEDIYASEKKARSGEIK
jgi:hypothetical protein